MKKFILLSICTLLLVSGLIAQQDGDIVWGGPGDPNSEFDGGLNDWTTVGVTDDDALWVWEADGKADLGAFSGGVDAVAIASPSVSNGAMVFDSDFYDNGGDNMGFGMGVAPAPATGELISPIMDLSDEFRVTLRFNEYHRNFQSTNAISYSMDGGTTWSDPQVVNGDVAINTAVPPTTLREVPIYGAEGSDQFRVKFIMQGNYYFWIIDDVQILRRDRNDLQVNDNFYAVAPNWQTPASQVDEFGFLVDISNLGGIEQTGVTVNMSIEDPSGTEIYSEDNDYGQVGDSLVENSSFGDFTPPMEIGTYNATYSISADAPDDVPENNQLSFEFMLTDSVFSKETGPNSNRFPRLNIWGAGDPHQWGFGHHYHVTNGTDHYATSVTFAIDAVGANTSSEIDGTDLDLRLYEWNDLNGDFSVSPDEREFVGFGIYTIQGNEESLNNGDLITVSLEGVTGGPPELSDDTDYLIMMEYRSPSATANLRFGTSVGIDYSAMQLNSQQQGRPRILYAVGFGGDLDNVTYQNGGFGSNVVPVVRLNVNFFSDTEEVTLEENTVTINPNPAKNVLNAQFDFAENTDNVLTRLMDVNGRNIFTHKYQNVTTRNESFDISKLSAGTYYLYVQTDEGRLIKKVIVQ